MKWPAENKPATVNDEELLSGHPARGGFHFLLIIIFATFFWNGTLFCQSIFLDDEYLLPTRAAAMSAYVADPDYPHAVVLNPAKLGFVQFVHAASDYQYFSRDVSELFLGDSTSNPFQNGKLAAWDVSTAFPVGPLGAGIAYTSSYLGGWRTDVARFGIGFGLPLGFAAGITGKYVMYTRSNSTSIPDGATQIYQSNADKFTVDVGIENRTVLADNTFFLAIVSSGATFSNILRSATLNPVSGPNLQPNPGIILPEVLTIGGSYLFASNYRVADFELFRLTGALDYSHLFKGSSPPDNLVSHTDQYRLGLEASALGILSLRLGYTYKAPTVRVEDGYNHLQVPMMGTGFSYGFSLRFPIKLVLPVLPITTIEMSYAKNPEWSSGMYHDLFGLTLEMLF
ncbi:MAG TPA: hypothetical protein VIS48_09130 [Candidatus Kryptonia bacterium]